MATTVSQPLIVVETLAERDALATTYPELQEGSTCRVTQDANREYRWRSQVWVQTRPDPMVLNALNQTDTNLQNQINTLTTSLSGKADSSSITTLANSIATELSGKASTASVTALAGDIAKKASVYLSGTQKTNPKFYVGSATVTGGNAVFYLTETGLVGGTGIFTNVYLDAIQPFMIDAASPPAFGQPTYNATTKALSIPVNKAQPALSILGLNVLGSTVAANGTSVKVLVLGD